MCGEDKIYLLYIVNQYLIFNSFTLLQFNNSLIKVKGLFKLQTLFDFVIAIRNPQFMFAVDSNKYNLKNATLLLTQLKCKYSKNLNSDVNNQHERQNTFIDEEEEDSMTTNNQFQNNGDSQSRTFKQKQSTVKQKSIKSGSYHQQREIHIQSQAISQFEAKKSRLIEQQKTKFCDLIIIKHLEDTLQLYQNDMQILQQNKQNYQEQICFLSQKIKKLPSIKNDYIALFKQKEYLNERLKQQVHKFHQSNKQVFKAKLQMQKQFKQCKKKIVSFFFLKNNPDFNSKIYQNQELNAFVNVCQDYYDQIAQKSIQIKTKLASEDQSSINKQKRQLIKKIFGTECQYITRLKDYTKEQKQQQKPNMNNNKISGNVERDQFTNNKSKKLSEAEKNLLLGDLKNFAKSFKLPEK